MGAEAVGQGERLEERWKQAQSPPRWSLLRPRSNSVGLAKPPSPTPAAAADAKAWR